ncbi:MAG: hypothetical protein DMF64_01995 [Acidobacteria bacterium]|nr:MAG: hypothetical protein DMF64_01995 [Acidobacteriota bacterium]
MSARKAGGGANTLAMETVAGIFGVRADAEAAVERLRALGISENNISLLMPGTTPEQLDERVPTTETEQPGMGTALGGAVGGAIGIAGGLHLGLALSSLFVPGVGPVLAAGVVGAALLGTGGAAAGMAAGGAIEENLAVGLPHDELFVYEDALRQGRTVVIAVAESDEQGAAARRTLALAGAETVDAACDEWWIGLRDAEMEAYTGQGSDFVRDEPIYRRGFEAALHPKARGQAYADDIARLRQCYGDECDAEAFRRGYERGQDYHARLRERYKG